MIEDGYGRFYADRLWGLLPAVYRGADSTGALRELIDRFGEQIAVVRRSIDRLGENQSIETCDDWVIPYIGDLVATRMLSFLPAAAQRVDVAKTIYYRRRAGTLGLLEELAADNAARDARAVEFFRRLARTRHQFDPEIGSVPAWSSGQTPPLAVAEALVGAYSRTPAGGFADLRNAHAANNADGAFDEYAHTADLRAPNGALGWYGLSRLGVFVWWLHAFQISGATPVSNHAAVPCFTFDPTGRDVQLFAPPRFAPLSPVDAFGENWVSPQEWELSVPISETLWREEADKLYPGAFSIGLLVGDELQPLARDTLKIHPSVGRFSFVEGTAPGVIASLYYFGYGSTIGAGGVDDGFLPSIDLSTLPLTQVTGGLDQLNKAVAAAPPTAAGATYQIVDSLTYNGPGPALTAAPGSTIALRAGSQARPVVRTTTANDVLTLTGQGQSGGNQPTLVLEGVHMQGADIVLAGDFNVVRLRLMTLDPGTSSGAGLNTSTPNPSPLFASAIDKLLLKPVTLWIEASIGSLILENCITGPIRTRNGGSMATLTATDSVIQSIPTHTGVATDPIFDPADLAARLSLGSDPLAAQVAAAMPAAAQQLLKNYKLGGPVSADLLAAITTALATLDRMKAEAAWPLALADLALGFSSGAVSLSRCTVLGRTYTHRLSASECVLDDIAQVEDAQEGCVRFTAYADGSQLHAPHRCVKVAPRAALFVTRLFGQPDHARLRPDADDAILAPSGGSILSGAASGSEMGAFSSELVVLRRMGLVDRFNEFMPVGQTPVWIDAS